LRPRSFLTNLTLQKLLLAGKESACQALGSNTESCAAGGPTPQCTPFRSDDYCPVDESFQSYIQSRTQRVKEDPDAIVSGGYWFHYLEDKLAAYKFTTSIGLTPPKIYNCTSEPSSLASFEPPADAVGKGFVVRATDLHSNHGVYVLPNGFDGQEIIRDIEMSASDIISDLLAMGVTKVIVEEYVGSSTSLPMEFKFHMFEGKIASINGVANRGTNCACKYLTNACEDRASLTTPCIKRD
jgi:hypothetical protein